MRSFFLGIFILLVAVAASSQTLTGVVVDENGAAVENATVILREGNTQIQRTQTNAEGRFSISAGITERSRLIVTAEGFATFEKLLKSDAANGLTVVLRLATVTGDVTVSVTRTETRLSETPASVVVFGRDELDSTASQTIDDTLRQVAGFTLFRRSSSKTANPTTHGANLRGVSGSGASRAAVLLDGLLLNDAFGGWTYWSRVPAIAVEQVEVLRGGASSLYGSGGLSGAVTLATSRPGDGEGILRVETSAGTQSTFGGSLFAAISKNKWTFDIAPESFKTGGYIPVAEDERGLVDTRANSKHNSVIGGMERRFGNSDARETFGRLFARTNLFSEDRENGTSLTNNGTYFRQIAAGGDLESDHLGRIELRTFLQAQVYDQTFSAVSVDRNSETLTRLQRVPSQATGGSAFWTRVFADHSIATSLEFRDVRGFSNEVGFGGGIPTTASGAGGRERTLAFFAQDHWRLGEHVVLALGGRYDRWRNFDALAVTRNLSTNAVTAINFADRDEGQFSPRISAIVSARDCVSFYASFSRSFRAPTLNELYRSFRVGNVVTQANENLRAETANTFEGGASFRSERVALRANAFVTHVADPVVSITLASTPTLITRQRQNVGRTRTWGTELDVEYSPRDNIRLSGSYLFADPRVTEFPANPVLIDKRLPQVAQHQGTIQLSYRPTSRVLLSIQGRTSSSQFEDDLNTLRLRPYFTMDVRSGFRVSESVEIFLAAENVLNSRYDIGLTPNRTVAAPAFVRVGLRLNFGKR